MDPSIQCPDSMLEKDHAHKKRFEAGGAGNGVQQFNIYCFWDTDRGGSSTGSNAFADSSGNNGGDISGEYLAESGNEGLDSGSEGFDGANTGLDSGSG